MEFEFDRSKSERNRQERGFGFPFAARIFAARVLLAPARTVDGEPRVKAIGVIEGVCHVVIFADRDGVRRIISARRANRKETAAWHASA